MDLHTFFDKEDSIKIVAYQKISFVKGMLIFKNLVCGGPVHSVLVREQMTVVHELTHTNELPCDTAQVNARD